MQDRVFEFSSSIYIYIYFILFILFYLFYRAFDHMHM